MKGRENLTASYQALVDLAGICSRERSACMVDALDTEKEETRSINVALSSLCGTVSSTLLKIADLIERTLEEND